MKNLSGLLTLMMILVFLQLRVLGQSHEELTVEGQLGYLTYDYEEPEKPVLFQTRGILTSSEIHAMPPLSKEERDFIEAQYSPMAIGVYRKLSAPIKFDLSKTLIPAVSEEFYVFGGRLTRLDEETLVWTTQFKSEQADELRIHFSEGYFPSGVKVNLFSSDDYAFNQPQLIGQVDEYGFYTTTTFADWLTMQVVIPLDIVGEPFYFIISGIVHSEQKYIENFLLDHCIEDAMCAQANNFTHINNLRLSAAQLTFVKDGGSFICSGGLLNDQRAADFQPYLLTADHCFNTQASAASLEARFDFRTTSCNGSNNPVILINGSNRIASNSQSDFMLVLLRANPALPRWYLGWTTAAPANLSTLHSVHHPGGQRQRYTRLTLYTAPSHTCANRPTSHYHYSRNTVGESFGGSSGAPVVNASNNVIGQNLGRCFETGSDNCVYSTYHVVWGKLSSSYNNNNLQYWLGAAPGASVAMSTSPASTLNFGTRDVGSNTNFNVTVTNTGTVPNFLNLEAGNVTITGTNASQFSIVGNTSLYLAPGQSGTFTVRFSPTSNGFKTATLNIPHNADNIASPRTITLTGHGNPCSDAVNMNNGGVANSGVFSRSGTGSWHTSSASVCGFTCEGRERLFYFTAPYTGTYRLHVTSTNSTWVNYMYRSGSCSSTGWTCISDVFNPGVYGSMSLTAGTTYYILLDSETTAITTHNFYIGTPGRWEGTGGSDWFTANNWYDGIIPDASTNVTIISGKPNSPVIGGGNTANCNNLVLSSGTLLTQNSTSYFYVNGNFDSDAGQFIMNGATSYLYFAGSANTWWDDDNENDTYTHVRLIKDTPTTQVMMWQDMTCNGSFEVREGRFAIDASWTLTVNGAFSVESGGILMLAPGKTIDAAGGVRFYDGSQSNITGGTIRCGGTFRIDDNIPYDIAFTNATVIMNGSGAQAIQDLDGNSIHHLIIDKPSGTASIASANLSISGNLTIENGTFNLGVLTCNVSGNTNINSGGILAMNNANNDLTSSGIFWNSGSQANVSAGNFYVNTMWDFKAGCNAQITTGNTAYIKNMYYPTEPTSHFGNLVIQPFSAITGNGEGRSISPVNVAGNMTIQTGASWGFNGPSGMVVSGNSIIQNGATLSFYSSAIFNTAGSLDISGTLTMTSSANALVNSGFAFPASGAINIHNANFISDNAFTSGWTNMNGTFNMSSGLFELTNNAPSFSATATTGISGGVLRAGAAFNATSPGVFIPTGGTVEILGTLPDGNIFCNNDNWFHDFHINATSGYTIHYHPNTIVKNSLIIDAGNLECGYGSSHTLNIGGNMTNNSLPGAFIPNTGLVTFDGSGAANHQHLSGSIGFYNVTNAKTGGGELRFTGAANIANNFIANNVNVVSGSTLGVGGLLDLSTGQLILTNAGPNVTVNNFTMGGTLGVAGGSFTCTDLTHNGILGVVNLSGGAITLNQADNQYTDLQGFLDISGGTLTINGTYDISIWGYSGITSGLTMTNGILDFNNPGVYIGSGNPVTTSISGGLIRTNGYFTVDLPGFTPDGGTVELYGGSDVMLGVSNGAHVYNLNINKSGSLLMGFDQSDISGFSPSNHQNREIESGRPKFETPSGRSGNSVITSNNLKVNNNTTINAGTLILQHVGTNAGNVVVNSGGKLDVNSIGSLAMGASKALTINNGGVLELNGTLSDQPKISRISSGNYAFNIESGGTIGAEYALFEHMNTSGVHIKAGAIVDPAKSFNYCTFRNGQSGGRLMTIHNSQTFSVNYATFPNNTWGGNYNVYKIEDSGVVSFGGFSGLFSGEANEWDPHSRIHWGGEIAPNVTLEGVEVGPGQDICFEATNTLTVGGGGSTFLVQNGGNANLVAGQKVVMLDGTRVYSGGYLLARITTTDDYCGLPPPILAVLEEKQTALETTLETEATENFFKVYPNPTTGRFTIELSEIATTVTVEIYGVIGEQILRQEVSGFMMFELDLSSQPRGIYIIRVLNGNEMVIQRVIRQ